LISRLGTIISLHGDGLLSVTTDRDCPGPEPFLQILPIMRTSSWWGPAVPAMLISIPIR
jgi:hypothetical protein